MPNLVYVLNGPNLNLLGKRQPEIYGRETLADVERDCAALAGELGLEVRFLQSNWEGQIVDWVHEAREAAVGIVINPGAFTHTSVAILDALNAFEGTVIEVHISTSTSASASATTLTCRCARTASSSAAAPRATGWRCAASGNWARSRLDRRQHAGGPPMMGEPLSLILLTALAAFLVGLSKGGLPSVGTLGVPVMALMISPVAAAALLLPIYLVTDWVGLWLYRRTYSARNLRILIPAGLAGVLFGWAVASRVSDGFVGLLVGLVGIGFCVNTWMRHRRSAAARPADVPRGVFWGDAGRVHQLRLAFRRAAVPDVRAAAAAGEAGLRRHRDDPVRDHQRREDRPVLAVELLHRHRPEAAAAGAAGGNPRHLGRGEADAGRCRKCSSSGWCRWRCCWCR